MLKNLLPGSVSHQCDKVVAEILGYPGDLEDIRKVAMERYRSTIAPMHDWRVDDTDWIVERVAVAAHIRGEFGVNMDPAESRLREFIRIKFTSIMGLPVDTVVLLAYLMGDAPVSDRVFLKYGVGQLNALGKQEYQRMYVFGPAEVYDKDT